LPTYCLLIAIWLEGAAKDKPREEGLGGKTKDDVDFLAVAVLPPAAVPSVLEHHIDRKGVEEDEIADEDAIDKAGNLIEIACSKRV